MKLSKSNIFLLDFFLKIPLAFLTLYLISKEIIYGEGQILYIFYTIILGISNGVSFISLKKINHKYLTIKAILTLVFFELSTIVFTGIPLIIIEPRFTLINLSFELIFIAFYFLIIKK